jgi:hypothetical protein
MATLIDIIKGLEVLFDHLIDTDFVNNEIKIMHKGITINIKFYYDDLILTLNYLGSKINIIMTRDNFIKLIAESKINKDNEGKLLFVSLFGKFRDWSGYCTDFECYKLYISPSLENSWIANVKTTFGNKNMCLGIFESVIKSHKGFEMLYCEQVINLINFDTKLIQDYDKNNFTSFCFKIGSSGNPKYIKIPISFGTDAIFITKFVRSIEQTLFFANKVLTYSQTTLDNCSKKLQDLKSKIIADTEEIKTKYPQGINVPIIRLRSEKTENIEVIIDTLFNGNLDLDYAINDNYNEKVCIKHVNGDIIVEKIFNNICLNSKHFLLCIKMKEITRMMEDKVTDDFLLNCIYNWDILTNVMKGSYFSFNRQNECIFYDPTEVIYEKDSLKFEFNREIQFRSLCDGKVSVKLLNLSYVGLLNKASIPKIQNIVRAGVIDKLQRDLGLVNLNLGNLSNNIFVDRAVLNNQLENNVKVERLLCLNIILPNDKYINFVINFNNKQRANDCNKTLNVSNYYSFQNLSICAPTIGKLAYLANKVASYSEDVINMKSNVLKDLYQKINEDSKMINEEIARKDRMRQLKLRTRNIIVNPIEPTFADLVQSEDYTREFLTQICGPECLKDTSLIQYVEPHSNVDKSIHDILLRSLVCSTDTSFKSMYCILQGLC